MEVTTLVTGETNLFFPLILLSFLTFVIFKSINAPKKPLPPCPYAWPILGNILQMGKSPNVNLAKLAKVHGPLMSLRFGAQLVVVGSSPEAAAEILKINDRALSGRMVSDPIKVKGSKLHNLCPRFCDECDDGWRILRTICRTELFSTKAMQSQVEIREKNVMDLVKYLGAKSGQVVKIKDIGFACALNILGNAFFSMDLTDFEGKGLGERMSQYMRRSAELGGVPQLSDLYPILSGWDLQRFYKKLMGSIEKIFAFWIDIAEERRKNKNDVSSTPACIDALIGMGLTNQQINPLLWELFTGGTESTSATTEWALTELLRNQEAMEKLRNELTEVIGKDTIRESNLSELPYLEACVKETPRLHPPGPLILRRAIQTCEVMGYTIPKGCQVKVNMWAIARDPTIWDDPWSFKPERFLMSGLDYKGMNFEYIPFGSGRRMCPGIPLASRVVPLVLASLVHHFDWFLPGNMNPSEINMNEMFDVFVKKKEPLCLIPMIRK
ncbi:probable (S)-N-methylcoclaurine 3'-hydroxylase isozyme 2 [Cornus florida]|uniref:probable (S)-N-methylcoclaurine 3'-hydroxylase isozyme 2 n=1 Tax=Cornus florida TaxID=4283 RepID=UPI0028A234B3|nr:probable (S)-N-methylcoclaurine 3'-hydroxylase isozyme 2 [Cornus florida]